MLVVSVHAPVSRMSQSKYWEQSQVMKRYIKSWIHGSLIPSPTTRQGERQAQFLPPVHFWFSCVAWEQG